MWGFHRLGVLFWGIRNTGSHMPGYTRRNAKFMETPLLLTWLIELPYGGIAWPYDNDRQRLLGRQKLNPPGAPIFLGEVDLRQHGHGTPERLLAAGVGLM